MVVTLSCRVAGCPVYGQHTRGVNVPCLRRRRRRSLSRSPCKTDGMVSLHVALRRVYKCLLSPLLGPRDRFVLTSTEYAVRWIASNGALRVGLLAMRLIG